MAFYRGTYQSASIQMDREVNIILPDDIKPGEQLKTLYLLHGYMGNHQQWMRFSSIERYAWGKRLAIVMPEAQNSYYIDHVHGFAHFQALNDLMIHVESIFPLSKQRHDRYVCGLSMGGYGALKWALAQPDLFAKAASLSGALDVTQMQKRLMDGNQKHRAYGIFGDQDVKSSNHHIDVLLTQAIKAKKTLPELYIACGNEDFLIHENEAFHALLDRLKIQHTFITSKGTHEWAFWDHYIQKVLDWL